MPKLLPSDLKVGTGNSEAGGSAGSDLFVEGPQLSVLPQRVQHLSGCLHHLHGVPAPLSVPPSGQFHQQHLLFYKGHEKVLLVSYPFPRPLLMSTSFSMPPLSAKALAFSTLRLVTSCSVQHTDATVSSESTEGLLPGSRVTRSRMAYLPGEGDGHGETQ